MDYYKAIKNEIINNELNLRIKDYSKNKYELKKYYQVGKLLYEAGNKYGDKIIKEYSVRLTKDFGKKYSLRYLFDIRKFYVFSNMHPVDAQLTISHYRLLFPLNDDKEIRYYIEEAIKKNLSKRELEKIIKFKEYDRLPTNVKNNIKEHQIVNFIKNPILLNNNSNYEIISEKILKKIILEDIETFMKELGNLFCFIGSEYKIKIGNTFNYIDLLLFNIEFNCYVVIELKVTELKKEHIGQIQVYMNYIDTNLKNINQNNTIGIIICKKENKYIIEYCSDKRIIAREYILI